MALSFFDQLLRCPTREQLITDCPALALFCFQEIVAAMQSGRRLEDPFPVDDEVAVLLSATSLAVITDRVFAETQDGASRKPFWCTFREALMCAWHPSPEIDGRWVLSEVAGKARIYGRTMERLPLATVSLQNALETSRVFLRAVTACALAGSADPLGDKRKQPIVAMLQFSRLIPQSTEVQGVTPEGLNFCMGDSQQQWWTLVSVALDRAQALAGGENGVSRTLLWQLLGVLFSLDTSKYVYSFPTKEEDLAAFHLLARLSEVGLVYPLLCEGQKCFVLSPHFSHAVCWSTTSPLCTATLLGAEGNFGHCVRREDEDTIITETNFRLYAYTRNPELLKILDQFAVKEAEVGLMIMCYRVTRSSFAAALRKGISTSHIIRFLSIKAHPSMLRHHKTKESEGVPGSGAPNLSQGVVDSLYSHFGAVVPQSFCDQLHMWERECRRLVFRHDLVLLRNLTAAQRSVLMEFLSRNGEGHTVVHEESGFLVVQRDVYERVLVPILSVD